MVKGNGFVWGLNRVHLEQRVGNTQAKAKDVCAKHSAGNAHILVSSPPPNI